MGTYRDYLEKKLNKLKRVEDIRELINWGEDKPYLLVNMLKGGKCQGVYTNDPTGLLLHWATLDGDDIQDTLIFTGEVEDIEGILLESKLILLTSQYIGDELHKKTLKKAEVVEKRKPKCFEDILKSGHIDIFFGE